VRYRFALLLSALLFSTGGAAIKAATVTGWQVACFRSAVAAVFLLAVVPGARRGWQWKMAPVVVAYAATLISFVLATRLTTAANAIFLQSTAPAYVLLMGPLLLKERIGRADVAYIGVVLAGMSVFFFGSQTAVATAPDPAKGNALGLVSGVFYACMLVGLRWLAKRGGGQSGAATVALGNVAACLAALPMALPADKGAVVTSLPVIGYLGVVQIGLAYLLLTWGLQHVPAVEASALMMVEPALNPVIAWVVHGERPGALAIAGGAVILCATAVNTLRLRGSG
jgi:drug/metabolite transporter (DMT)-like permease